MCEAVCAATRLTTADQASLDGSLNDTKWALIERSANVVNADTMTSINRGPPAALATCRSAQVANLRQVR